MGKGPFKITIEGEKLRIEREITRQQLATIIAWPEPDELQEEEETEEPPFRERPVNDPAPTRSRPQVSLGEFARELSVSNNFQKVAAICAYHEDHRGSKSISWDDVKAGFRRAGWSVPKNLGRDIKKAMGRGLVDEDINNRGHYWVTQLGRETIGLDDAD